MIESNIKQLKMVNGDELLCEILEELDEDLIVRYCLLIEKIQPSKINESMSVSTYYSLVPWMTYVELSAEVITLSKYHCMGFTIPNKELLGQYGEALKKIIETSDDEIGLNEPVEDMSNKKNVISFLRKPKSNLH